MHLKYVIVLMAHMVSEPKRARAFINIGGTFELLIPLKVKGRTDEL